MGGEPQKDPLRLYFIGEKSVVFSPLGLTLDAPLRLAEMLFRDGLIYAVIRLRGLSFICRISPICGQQQSTWS